jgi:hypothetical protein
MYSKSDLGKVKKSLDEINEKINSIDQSSIIEKQIEIDSIKKELDQLRVDERQKENDKVKLYEQRGALNNEVKGLSNELNKNADKLDEYTKNHKELLYGVDERYIKEVQSKSYEEIYLNFNRRSIQTQTIISNDTNTLKDLQAGFCSEYEFAGGRGIEAMQSYLDESLKIRTSTIQDYEAQIIDAKRNSENEFRESFIHRLRENINEAKTKFRSFNKILNGIKFGDDSYKFIVSRNDEFKHFYDMITDDQNMGEETLFSSEFNKRHEQAIQELFTRISSETLEGQKELELLTDYRTYLSFDIEVQDKKSSYLFSKVSSEKSGGETQTPYYVTIAASMKNLYNQARLSSKISLILLDEAFEKMDESRIKSMMRFFKELGLQVILAVPSQNAEQIIPYVGTVVTVFNDGDSAIVEALTHQEVI